MKNSGIALFLRDKIFVTNGFYRVSNDVLTQGNMSWLNYFLPQRLYITLLQKGLATQLDRYLGR